MEEMLIPILEGWSVIIAGSWNVRIFSPRWIMGGRLTSATDVPVEIPLDDPSDHLRYTIDDVYLVITSQRLILRPTRADPSLLDKVESMALKILQELPQTPVKAVGMNFQYLEKSPSVDDALLFELRDISKISNNNLQIKATSIKRTFGAADCDLNFTMTLRESKDIVYDFNYNAAVTSVADIVPRVTSKLRDRHRSSLSLMKDLYDKSVE